MGLFTKSVLLLLIAVSTPLVYRQLVNDKTVKFTSSYYKSVDQFLKQSANHIDRAKEFLRDAWDMYTFIFKREFDRWNKHTNDLIASTSTSQSPDEPTKSEGSASKEKTGLTSKVRLAQCPSENLQGKKIRLWSKPELAKYDGNSGETDIYLAFLGLVYNVTINTQHYAGGAEYNAFAGRDATRAFVTGNFTHDLHDNIQDIDISLYSHVEGWASFYNTSYPIVGRVEGQFFDSRGCSTPELARVYKVFIKLEQDKANLREQEKDFPECNSEWNSDTKKGRVWCSTKSGGIERDWVGVPRIYNNGESQRCACFNQNGLGAAELEKFMSVYPGCDPEASDCALTQQ